MIEYKIGALTIVIDLCPGIYSFDSKSSTGKTRLYRELRKLQLHNFNVISFSYNDKKLGLDLRSFKNKPDLVMLDRYDMYNGDYVDYLNSLKNSIILIDCKGILPFSYELCFIEMGEDRIEVTS